MARYVLSIDCGTQSLRAIVFDEKGEPVIKVKRPIGKYRSDKAGMHEADAEMFWQLLKDAVIEARSISPEIFDSVEAISVTTQRDTGILVDKNGVPLRRAIIWMDEREVDYKPINPFYNAVFGAVGMSKVISNLRCRAQAHWLKVNEPENWKKAYKFIFLSTYLNFKLTGLFADSDASLCGHIPFNYKTRNWDAPHGIKSLIFEIEREKLCSVVPSLSVIGLVTDQAAEELHLKKGLPVVASGSDKACETIGVGCRDNTTAAVSLGSQTTIETTTEKYYELDPFFPPFTSVRHNSFNPEITIYRGFWMVSWFENEFASYETLEAEEKGIEPLELLNSRLNDIPAGSEGLVLQPYWGVNLTKPQAKGCIVGFSDVHTRFHMYRAIIEGIAYAVLEGVEKIESVSHMRLEKIALSGGGSQSDAICQIAANVLGRTVYRVQTYESSALGAAVAAFTAVKAFPDFDTAISAMVHPKDFFYPDPKQNAIYKTLYEKVYKKLYNNLKPVYRYIAELLKQNDNAKEREKE